MKVLIFSNIPSPYRIDFFNELGKFIDLTVVFEATQAKGIRFNWNIDEIKHFEAIFLRDGEINENKVDWSILKYISKDQFDHVIVTSYAYLTEMVALVALKILRIPYFMEVDGGLIREEHFFKKSLKKFLISNASGYFSPSKSSDEYLVYYGANREKIFRYPFTSLKKQDILILPISNEEKVNIRNELGINESSVILAVGQFIHRKGFDVLLSASKKLDKSIGVVFVGGEPTIEYLNFVNQNNLSNIYFEGFKSKEELSKYFKMADLFILPTREDVWGLVINEAMSYGLPVITTNKCGAGLELIYNRENGYIVQVDDIEELSKSIKAIINSKTLKTNIAYNNLEKIKGYSIEEMASVHLQHLNEAFNKKGRGN